MGPDFFSGWGVRTVAVGESRYNPMSYHNGTVWPHDCSLVAAGLSRYGRKEWAGRILTGMFDVACRLPEFRMPELLCGFPRRAGEGPVCFPSACTPQAWASGAVFLMLQSVLGLEIDAVNKLLKVTEPHLPAWLDHVLVEDLSIAGARASLLFHRKNNAVEVDMSDATNGIRLELIN